MATVNLGSLSEAGSGVARVPLCGDFRAIEGCEAHGEANLPEIT
jgi:hypothetical protein